MPKSAGDVFPTHGSHLERYASVFTCVEINSCFYRPHQPKTYLRWAGSVPAHFKFSVKLPKEITHKLRLQNVEEPLNQFLEQVGHLGSKLGPILIQLPPSFAWSEAVIDSFLAMLRDRFEGQLAIEPRHRTWFVPEVEKILEAYRVARVAADPAVVPDAAHPGGWTELVYYRLHGSPKMYYSTYSTEYLNALAGQIASVRGEAWCIFDNTALGAATENALCLGKLVYA